MSNAIKASKPMASYMVKLENRRVKGFLMPDQTICWQFMRLTPERTIGYKTVRLSIEALSAMVAIAERLVGFARVGDVSCRHDREDKAR